MKNITINGKKLFAFRSTEELHRVINEKKVILIAIGTEKILNTDPSLTIIINENLGYPDGIGAVLALGRKGIKSIKIPGAQLWLEIIKRNQRKKSFYLLGSKQSVIIETVKKLRKEYPEIDILKYRDGYFSEEELKTIKREIVQLKPDVIFVAMGSPKQEYIMADFFNLHPALYMGLGGSFDLYCGVAKKVPDWWNRFFRWEGLYRSFNDIKNIKRWKRQLPALRIIYKILLNQL